MNTIIDVGGAKIESLLLRSVSDLHKCDKIVKKIPTIDERGRET